MNLGIFDLARTTGLVTTRLLHKRSRPRLGRPSDIPTAFKSRHTPKQFSVFLIATKKRKSPVLYRGFFFFFARTTGLEPATSRVLLVPLFSQWHGLYLYPALSRVGTSVSSLYGAPMKQRLRLPHGVPSVFACLPIDKFSLHRYPKEFQSAFRSESCTSTGGCSNQLSYVRIFKKSSKTRFFRCK